MNCCGSYLLPSSAQTPSVLLCSYVPPFFCFSFFFRFLSVHGLKVVEKCNALPILVFLSERNSEGPFCRFISPFYPLFFQQLRTRFSWWSCQNAEKRLLSFRFLFFFVWERGGFRYFQKRVQIVLITIMHVEALVASCALEGRTSFNASLAHNALFLPSSTLCEVLSLCFCSFLGAFGTPRKTDRRFFFQLFGQSLLSLHIFYMIPASLTSAPSLLHSVSYLYIYIYI